MNLGNFFAELKRRNVYKVAVAYLVGGWALAQGIAQVFPVFDIPNWVVRLIVLLIILGLPIALSLAWAFELTPEGIKRTEVADAAQIRSKNRAWIYVVALGLMVSLGLFFLGRFTASRPGSAAVTEPGTNASIPAKSIAVLPFDSLSEDKANAYFAQGIQDEILTKLASVADLRVISRSSTEKYKSKPEDLKTVSQQLGVATVVEGSVQRAGDKVRINVQLIDARADAHIWAKGYDRDVKDVFAVESEVAQEIADALQARLSPAEVNTLAAAPTKDPGAYDLFLKGEFEEREAESSLKPEAFDQAASWYRQAIARDPNFALGFARLAASQMNRHWFLDPLSEADLAQVKNTVEHALALAPNLAEAHIAFGLFYYYGHRQYDQALSEFKRAIELQPNGERAMEYSAYVHRRQGKWETSLSELKKCEQQNPRDASLVANIAASYDALRMWKEATQAGTRSIAIDPHDVFGMRALLLSCLNGYGDVKQARRLMDTFPSDARITTKSVHGVVVSLMGERACLSVIERDFAAALKVWETPGRNRSEERQRMCARVAIHAIAGDAEGSATEIQTARELAEARLNERPADDFAMTQLSWINLAQNRNTEALDLARQAAAQLPLEKDVLVGGQMLTGLAQIEARTGHPAEAIELLKRLLSLPTGDYISIARLKIDPVWDPIRDDPGFQQLLAGKESIGPPR